MYKLTPAVAILCLLLCVPISSASPIPPFPGIDLRTWVGADGQTSYNLMGSIVSTNYKLSQGEFGIGVNSGGFDALFGIDDEVDWGNTPPEMLTFSFPYNKIGHESYTCIDGFWLSNFYSDELGGIDEKGKVIITTPYSELVLYFTADSSDGNFQFKFGGSLPVISMTFMSDNIIGDYSVVGFLIPEPATLILAAVGLIGLAGFTRKRCGSETNKNCGTLNQH